MDDPQRLLRCGAGPAPLLRTMARRGCRKNSQVGRERSSPAARRRRRRASSNTRRNEGGLARCSRQARRPASPLAAGTDAASMARQCPITFKNRRMFFSTRPGVSAAGWAGACFAGGCATSLGILRTYTKVSGAARPRCADEFHRTPKEIAAVQARFQMAARRRNKPPPTLSPPRQPPARSAKPRHPPSAIRHPSSTKTKNPAQRPSSSSVRCP